MGLQTDKTRTKTKNDSHGKERIKGISHISNSAVKPFRAQIRGEGDPANITTHHFLVSCII
jgi:hypothetical protein